MKKNSDCSLINNHLKFMISKKLNKDMDDITKEFLNTLQEIDLSECSIKDLHGIQYASNLTNLNLSKNEIVDASLLSQLNKLTMLELSDNKIEDVNFLSKLENLKSIGLDGNNISNIGTLNNLKHLVLINVSNNKIKDLSFINDLNSDNIKVLASEQCILLNPVDVDYGEDYVFNSPIQWDRETIVFLDNIQLSGKYNDIKSNKKPSLLYSISQVLIKNIRSNCLLKADFYHEVPFLKSGIMSGILLQPIRVKLEKSAMGLFKNNITTKNWSICGKLIIKENEYDLSSKLITIINSDGKKFSCLTNQYGEYKFSDLKKGRYTILFPFLSDYRYITPSLYVCNLEKDTEINSIAIKE